MSRPNHKLFTVPQNEVEAPIDRKLPQGKFLLGILGITGEMRKEIMKILKGTAVERLLIDHHCVAFERVADELEPHAKSSVQINALMETIRRIAVTRFVEGGPIPYGERTSKLEIHAKMKKNRILNHRMVETIAEASTLDLTLTQEEIAVKITQKYGEEVTANQIRACITTLKHKKEDLLHEAGLRLIIAKRRKVTIQTEAGPQYEKFEAYRFGPYEEAKEPQPTKKREKAQRKRLALIRQIVARRTAQSHQ